VEVEDSERVATMAMRREGELQGDLLMTLAEMPRSPGHVFYNRLQELLSEAGFDAFVEETCKPFYAPKMGAPSLPPGRYFRMHMIGYFEGLASERGIVWRCADSRSLGDFLRLGSRDKVPDHSWLSKTRSRLPYEVHEKVFEFVLKLVAERGLVKGERIGVGGAIVYACMDWRHMGEMLATGRTIGFDLLNLCVWVKCNGGMGSLYRSRHELVFVFRNGKEAHLNNVQWPLRANRTNVWNYAGTNSFPRKGQASALDLHPTVKPIAMVSEAILDSTKRNDIVLDPFCGSGTTLLAAERTGRHGYGIEIDPLYVETAIARWERMTGKQARHASGQTFADIKAERRIAP